MTTARIILLGSMASAAIALAGCATIEEAVAEKTTTTYTASLTGAQEPGGGDREGAGRAEISIRIILARSATISTTSVASVRSPARTSIAARPA